MKETGTNVRFPPTMATLIYRFLHPIFLEIKYLNFYHFLTRNKVLLMYISELLKRETIQHIVHCTCLHRMLYTVSFTLNICTYNHLSPFKYTMYRRHLIKWAIIVIKIQHDSLYFFSILMLRGDCSQVYFFIKSNHRSELLYS